MDYSSSSIFLGSAILIILIAFLIGRLSRLSKIRMLEQREEKLLGEVKTQQQNFQQLQYQLQYQLQSKETLLDETQKNYAQLDQRYLQLHQQSLELRTQNAQLSTQLQRDAAHHQEKLALQEQSRAQLKQEFEQLAGKIFQERSQQFSQQSQQNLHQLLEPLRQQVFDFRNRLEGFNEQQIKRESSLTSQLSQLAQLNQQMSQDAHNLTRALKNDQKQQGNWGELMLETVLERSGLRKGIEFKREVSFKTNEGVRRPDVVIYLPEDRHLIVDAKVSLTAYTDYLQAIDETQQSLAIKQLIRSMRQHLEDLSQRDYNQLPGLNSPELIFMFVPIEPAFALAFESDSQLFHDAFARHIVIVTPTTLLASLRIVAQLWRLEKHNENARLIVQRGEKLLDKFSGFVESLSEIGTHLNRAQKSQQQAMDRLVTGNGSLASQARALIDLGVRSKRPLPEVKEDNFEGLSQKSLEVSVSDDQSSTQYNS